MESLGGQSHPTALRAGRTLWRRKWIIVLTTLVVAGASIALSLRQPALYQASATVLLKYQSLASGLTGIQDLSTVYQDPTRIAQTQTQIAMSPAVADKVAAAIDDPPITASEFQGISSVVASADSDVLIFTVTYGDPEAAPRLATEHARQFIDHRRELDTASIVAARRELQGRIAELEQSEFRDSPLLEQLIQSEQQLRTMEALQTANASLLRPATSAWQIQPTPRRSAMLGVILGLMLGIGLAFAREALDTRVRTSGEIGEALGLTLLARLPAPPKKLRSENRLVMVANPHGPHAEAFRMLRANLEFVNLDRGAKTILVTSALEREGKSTTVANLAVALARAGQKVALVDLDLRRPGIAQFFAIPDGGPGVTNVVVGSVPVERALVEVVRMPGGKAGMSGVDGNGAGSTANAGVLKVLTSGPVPRDPGELVNASRLQDVLEELARTFDYVLIDSPPLLSVGDAMSLSAHSDGLIAVARLNVVRRPQLNELQRALETCPTIKLGVVVTGAEAEAGYGMGYGGYDYYRSSDDEYWINLPPETSAGGREGREERVR